jgi:CRP/FNR family transcriptional regulator
VSTVFALPLQGLQALRLQCPALDDALQIALSRQLVRCAELTEILAAVASDVRMARFLLWMAARMAERGQSPRRLLLRMCRRDIASLLGVAHETVSRSFTTMAEAGFIRVDNRQVEIVDRAGLQLRARTTRGGPEVCAAAPQRRGAGPVARAPVAWFSSLEQGARVQA